VCFAWRKKLNGVFFGNTVQCAVRCASSSQSLTLCHGNVGQIAIMEYSVTCRSLLLRVPTMESRSLLTYIVSISCINESPRCLNDAFNSPTAQGIISFIDCSWISNENEVQRAIWIN
jgi:hypothetical protein